MASEAPENTEQRPPTQNGQPEPHPVVDGPNPPPPSAPSGLEPRLPTRKDVSLREFMLKIDDYAPIVRPLPRLCFPFA